MGEPRRGGRVASKAGNRSRRIATRSVSNIARGGAAGKRPHPACRYKSRHRMTYNHPIHSNMESWSPTVELRALRYFVEVVRQQSFTVAAEQMFVTQPTISKMVKSLGRRDRLAAACATAGRWCSPTPAASSISAARRCSAGARAVAGGTERSRHARARRTHHRYSADGRLALHARHRRVPPALPENRAEAVRARTRAPSRRRCINGELELGGVLQPVDLANYRRAADHSPDCSGSSRAPARPGTRLREVPLAGLAEASRSCSTARASRSATSVLNACRERRFRAARSSGAADIGISWRRWCWRASASRCCPRRTAGGSTPAQFTCRPVVDPEIPWEMAIGWRRNGISVAARALAGRGARERCPAAPAT